MHPPNAEPLYHCRSVGMGVIYPVDQKTGEDLYTLVNMFSLSRWIRIEVLTTTQEFIPITLKNFNTLLLHFDLFVTY